MVLRIREGKRGKDRLTLLSDTTLTVLRKYWKLYQPKHLLFPGQKAETHITPNIVRQSFRKSVEKAGITKNISLRAMRAIEICRTVELGGRMLRCDACDVERPEYNYIAQNVSLVELRNGLRPGEKRFYRSIISMWCSRYLPNLTLIELGKDPRHL
ncbi:hypothetical protein DID80_06130 [Candidatus Marinamargulisbacteria bacterium SCGC AAA071-K20]|nr:hypothetical protein DID80_06130 [Candidatus Marinamargulisbacteria bacterium SCGC AAA071-K20]